MRLSWRSNWKSFKSWLRTESLRRMHFSKQTLRGCIHFVAYKAVGSKLKSCGGFKVKFFRSKIKLRVKEPKRNWLNLINSTNRLRKSIMSGQTTTSFLKQKLIIRNKWAPRQLLYKIIGSASTNACTLCKRTKPTNSISRTTRTTGVYKKSCLRCSTQDAPTLRQAAMRRPIVTTCYWIHSTRAWSRTFSINSSRSPKSAEF